MKTTVRATRPVRLLVCQALLAVLALAACASGPTHAPPDARSVPVPDLAGGNMISAEMEPRMVRSDAAVLGPIWRTHTDYLFSPQGHSILRTDESKTSAIAIYMRQNPEAQLRLDGSDETRVFLVRDALINAGVPPGRIFTGQFGEARQRRDTRVEVLIDR